MAAGDPCGRPGAVGALCGDGNPRGAAHPPPCLPLLAPPRPVPGVQTASFAPLSAGVHGAGVPGEYAADTRRLGAGPGVLSSVPGMGSLLCLCARRRRRPESSVDARRAWCVEGGHAGGRQPECAACGTHPRASAHFVRLRRFSGYGRRSYSLSPSTRAVDSAHRPHRLSALRVRGAGQGRNAIVRWVVSG
jgi:hypothetical protein